MIQVIASSSSGNCLILTHKGSRLLLEAGIPFRQIQQAAGFQLSGFEGCLLTHEHIDHSRSIKKVAEYMPCYMSEGTASALNLSGHHIHKTKHADQFQTGNFICVGFNAVHDAPEPLNYLISCGDEKILFATDTAIIQPRFIGLTRIIIECNWDEAAECLYKNRLYSTHLSLNQCADFIRRTDRYKLKEIVLIHMSGTNIDSNKALSTISAIAGQEVTVR